MSKDYTPLIALPPGYIVLSREDYDGLTDRIHNINSNAYEDVRMLNDEIAYLRKILEEKQDEIVTLHETIDDERDEKCTMLDRIGLEIKYNGELEKKIGQYQEYLVMHGQFLMFKTWLSQKESVEADTATNEDALDASLEELREPGP